MKDLAAFIVYIMKAYMFSKSNETKKNPNPNSKQEQK